MKIFQLLGLTGLVSAAVIQRRGSVPKAVYFMSNKPGKNTIHALPVNSAGMMVHHGTLVETGGRGSRAPSTIGLTDALNSQGALQISGNRLYVVNAGSNDVSVLSVNPANPVDVTLLGAPISSGGDWPNTIAISDALQTVCVGNSGANSGIACFKMTAAGLEPDGAAFRPLTLDPKQSTPPQGPFNTVSQVFFAEDDSALYATVKGTPITNASNTGYLSYFPVKNGKVSTKETRSSPEGTAVLFGSVSLPNRMILATDAAFGAVLLSVSKAGVATTVKKIAIPNNGATCWSAQSPATGLIYTTDDGNDQVAALDPTTGAMVAVTELTNGNPNMIELVATGDLMYALSHGNSSYPQHVVALKTIANGGVETVQNFAPYGVGINVEGMALYL